MRVVITGATGNVGTSLVAALAADPEVTEIVGLARRLPATAPPKTTWQAADVRHDDLARHFRGADAVVHLAWLFQPTHRQPVTWNANVEGSIRVFDAVAEAGVPALVHASSVGAYSPGPKDRAVDERWPTNGYPSASYVREKVYVERVLDAFERDHPSIRVVRLRPAFIFKREAASEQRRLFAGPLLPNRLVRPGLIPIVPDIPGLRLQALHSADAGEAYRLAVMRDVRGAFNVAAEPVLDPQTLAEVLHARPVKMPVAPLRGALSLAWHLRLAPVDPGLLDVALRLPIMDTTRAREQLGWSARHDALDAVRELLEGIREGAGGDTPPLAADAGGRGRVDEFRSGIGEHASPR